MHHRPTDASSWVFIEEAISPLKEGYHAITATSPDHNLELPVALGMEAKCLV